MTKFIRSACCSAAGAAVGLEFALLLAMASCGYRPLHGTGREERLAVVLASSNVPDAVATDEVLAGVREELAKLGALSAGSGYPRCEVEVLRADESSEGVEAAPRAEGPRLPTSRATRVGLVVRAWVARGPGERAMDTGDLRAFELSGTAGDARSAAFSYDDTLRTAGRRAGRRLADRIVGLPAATDE